jgi:lipoprotein-anchoring transpeptidase ErfK/SrfK
MRNLIAAASLLALAACGMNGTDRQNDQDNSSADATAIVDDNGADTMASADPAPGEPARTAIADPEQRPVMQAQVVLERQGFGPGVIDGKMGMSTENALKGYQEANGLDVTGRIDAATRAALAKWDNIPATRVVTIPPGWGTRDYRKVPDDAAEQAKLQRLGYESLDERLAERFHTTVEVLKALNPGGMPAGMGDGDLAGGGQPAAQANAAKTAEPSPTSPASTAAAGAQSYFTAGKSIRVPNVGADRIEAASVQDKGWQATLASLGVGTEQRAVAKIVVDKSDDWLKGYDAGGKLVALFTVTSGSSHDPLPLGNWGITGIAHNPPFAYNPELFWDVPDGTAKQQLPPGPNGPVGVVWIDLTKEHYGIHGTAEPETIGRAQSHGCVRLTNWDAARLAQMVGTSTKVVFRA